MSARIASGGRHDGVDASADNPLSAYRRVLTDRWPWVVLLMFATLGLASAYLLAQNESYDSKSTVFISTPRDDFDTLYRGNLYALERAPSYAALLQSPDLAERVKNRLRLSESADELMANTTAVIVPGTVLIQLTTKADTPGLAQSINQGFVDEFVDQVASLESVPGAIAPRAQLLVVEKPTLPSKPGGFPPTLILGAAAAVGLTGGATLAVLLTLADKRIRRPEDAQECVGEPLLAVFSSPSTRERMSDAARLMRDTLMSEADASRSRVIMIASAESRAGRSTTAQLLCEAFRDQGASVALVDLDFRKSPKVLRRAGDGSAEVNEHVHTVSDVVRGTMGPDELVGKVVDGITHIPAGDLDDDPARASDSPRIPLLIERIRSEHSLVVVDTAPCDDYSDALRLAAHVDTTVFVARHGKTRFDRLRGCVDEFRTSHRALSGVVLTGLPAGRKPRSATPYRSRS